MLDSHKHALVSISGGSDSDVMLDLIYQSGHLNKCSFLFVNTGLEYKATTDHLDYLEERYRIHIDRVRQAVPVPRVVRNYGVPIISKYVSEMIHCLQNNRFDWSDDRPYDALLKDYPTCKEGLKWWTDYYKLDNGSPSAFSIRRFKGLKEYLMLSPPTFKVSNMCCDKSKKRQFNDAVASYDCDLNMVGVRRQEGGIRATIKTCYSKGSDGIDTYRPIFWFSNGDKSAYCAANGIVHSDCYSKWGFRRTGCTGCPYNPNYRADIALVARYEPRMAHQAECTFGKAYEWQDGYREFRKEMDAKNKREKMHTPSLDEY